MKLRRPIPAYARVDERLRATFAQAGKHPYDFSPATAFKAEMRARAAVRDLIRSTRGEERAQWRRWRSYNRAVARGRYEVAEKLAQWCFTLTPRAFSASKNEWL